MKYLFHIQIFSKPATLKADSLKQTAALWFQQLLFPVVTINSLEKDFLLDLQFIMSLRDSYSLLTSLFSISHSYKKVLYQASIPLPQFCLEEKRLRSSHWPCSIAGGGLWRAHSPFNSVLPQVSLLWWGIMFALVPPSFQQWIPSQSQIKRPLLFGEEFKQLYWSLKSGFASASGEICQGLTWFTLTDLDA